MKTNTYTLKYIDQEFYLLCASKPRVGCGVVETLTDGTSMLMTIHNPNDIDLKNQKVIIASTRKDLDIPQLIVDEKEYTSIDSMIISGCDEWEVEVEMESVFTVCGKDKDGIFRVPGLGSCNGFGEAAASAWDEPRIKDGLITITKIFAE